MFIAVLQNFSYKNILPISLFSHLYSHLFISLIKSSVEIAQFTCWIFLILLVWVGLCSVEIQLLHSIIITWKGKTLNFSRNVMSTYFYVVLGNLIPLSALQSNFMFVLSTRWCFLQYTWIVGQSRDKKKMKPGILHQYDSIDRVNVSFNIIGKVILFSIYSRVLKLYLVIDDEKTVIKINAILKLKNIFRRENFRRTLIHTNFIFFSQKKNSKIKVNKSEYCLQITCFLLPEHAHWYNRKNKHSK